MSQMPFFLPLPPPLCYNDIVGTAEKTRIFLPRSPTDPIPRTQKMERPGARCAKQRASGHFPAKSKPKGPAAQPGRPRFYPIPPAHLCRSAGLRPAGQTVLRTVLGGGLRPPPRRRRAPPALRASPLPFLAAPQHPHAKGPAAQPGRPRFYPILTARTAPPPAAPPQTAPVRGWRYPAARRR